MKKIKILASYLAMLSAGVIGHAQAATTTSSFQVSATVENSCTVSATNMSFTSFSQTTGTITAQATITPVCTSGAPYTISINSGAYSDGTNRKMRHSTNTAELLIYTLTKDDGTTAIPIGTSSYSATGTGPVASGGTDQTITIRGHLDTMQRVAAGSYADTLTITVTY